MLRDEINNALKDAMKAGDKRRVSTLRLVNAEILKRETSAAERAVAQRRRNPRRHGQDDQAASGIARDIRQGGARATSPRRSARRSTIISAYMPKHLSDIEAGEAISALIKELEAATIKDMGRTMAALKERFAGQMDFGKASAMVKKLLAG